MRMSAGDVLRRVRWARRLSQRELAALAGIPSTTVDRIESGYTADPRLSTLETILNATGFRLAVVNQFDRLLTGGRANEDEDEDEDEDNRHYDRGARRFPAHLPVEAVVGEGQDGWWGWRRIAWQPDDPKVPPFTYSRRRKAWVDPYYADQRWNDAT